MNATDNYVTHMHTSHLTGSQREISLRYVCCHCPVCLYERREGRGEGRGRRGEGREGRGEGREGGRREGKGGERGGKGGGEETMRGGKWGR